MNLLEEIEDHPLCADGAMGTLLMERGILAAQCLEELCVSQPDLVSAIHAEYLEAGARIIRTNSFGANPARLANHGLEGRVNEINWQAAQIAKLAAKGTGAYVAGSVGPLGIPAEEAAARGIDREECFRTQIGALLDGGVNLICLETFQDPDELLLALRVKHSLHHCPAICSLAPGKNGDLPGGTSISEAFGLLVRNDAEILGLNCITSDALLAALENAMPAEIPLAVFPSAGLPRHQDGRSIYETPPQEFARAGLALAERGARIIGGCCGTTPAHIATLAKAINQAESP